MRKAQVNSLTATRASKVEVEFDILKLVSDSIQSPAGSINAVNKRRVLFGKRDLRSCEIEKALHLCNIQTALFPTLRNDLPRGGLGDFDIVDDVFHGAPPRCQIEKRAARKPKATRLGSDFAHQVRGNVFTKKNVGMSTRHSLNDDLKLLAGFEGHVVAKEIDPHDLVLIRCPATLQ